MPLRDHFRPPVLQMASWEGLHAMWPAYMVGQLRKSLPPGFTAEPRVHLGTLVELDAGALLNDAVWDRRITARRCDDRGLENLHLARHRELLQEGGTCALRSRWPGGLHVVVEETREQAESRLTFRSVEGWQRPGGRLRPLRTRLGKRDAVRRCDDGKECCEKEDRWPSLACLWHVLSLSRVNDVTVKCTLRSISECMCQ